MTFAQEAPNLFATLAARVGTIMKDARTDFSNWLTYRETVGELAWRDEHLLDDLGMAPGDVRPVARAASYR
ncbi:DUF1127 domain-containing protein [Pontivivens insulae]|uniref:YjiS-like domain-containing protein n=1 Tax=Pontivivens insulae TaxID=1639689 RepID=A0A2R8AEV4_9RHOB|nr:DUF1127 domain-containing protein [Pontivivens insulae]RED12013.1 uncharacterized protein YjiS (DUF1127 family) [Pontivivens insulae]SPF30769.1 hypothetical protein POI8812_03112 [Pontivivens insulae]